MLSNHPNALGGGSTSSGGGEAGVFSRVLVADGSAAAPSYSFTSDSTEGWYRISSNAIGLAFNGVIAGSLQSSASGLLMQGATSAGFINLPASGAIALTAAGTNQSITLTPSGTGALVTSMGDGVSGAIAKVTSTGTAVMALQGTGGGAQSFYFFPTDSNNSNAYLAHKLATSFNIGYAGSVNGAITSQLVIATNSGNLLLGGLTTDGTGVLQLPAATTAAGGITLGNVNIFQNATNALTLGASAGTTMGGLLDMVNNNLQRVNIISTGVGNGIILQTNGTTTALTLDSSQGITAAKKIVSYNGVATAGWGVGAIQAAAEVTAQAAANASIATYTVGAVDGTFRVSAQLDCTVSTVLSTTLQCTYTDKSNTARTMIFPIQQLTGSFIAGGLITGTGAWETPVMHIRCKAATAITILTATGTFTGVTYSADAVIEQVA